MTRASNSQPSTVAQGNEAVVRYLFERVYSKGELHRIDDVVTTDFAGEDTESAHRCLGPVGVRAHVVRLRTAFDGFTVEIRDLHVDDDGFEVSWIATGTHERRFQNVEPMATIGQIGVEPHGNRITITGDTSGTFRDGKIDETLTEWDAAELHRQLKPSIGDAERDIDDRVPTARDALLDGKPEVGVPTIHTSSGRGGR